MSLKQNKKSENKMKTSAKTQIASVSVASTEVSAETTAITKKGIAKGELKAYQEMLLEKTKSGEIKFEEVDANTLVAKTAAGATLTMKLVESELSHEKTKAGKMIRVRLTTEKFDEAGNLVAKKAECNGKEIWAVVKPETQFPRGSAPKSTKHHVC